MRERGGGWGLRKTLHQISYNVFWATRASKLPHYNNYDMMILYYTSDLDTIYYMYLFRVISVGFLKVSLSCHWYERVLDIVRLE